MKKKKNISPGETPHVAQQQLQFLPVDWFSRLGGNSPLDFHTLPFFLPLSFLVMASLLLLFKEDHNLHDPMYYFLAMRAATDLELSLTPVLESSGWITGRLET